MPEVAKMFYEFWTHAKGSNYQHMICELCLALDDNMGAFIQEIENSDEISKDDILSKIKYIDMLLRMIDSSLSKTLVPADEDIEKKLKEVHEDDPEDDRCYIQSWPFPRQIFRQDHEYATDYDRFKNTLYQAGVSFVDCKKEIMIFLYELGIHTHGVDLRFDDRGKLQSFDTFFGEWDYGVKGEDRNAIYFTNEVSDICRETLTDVAKTLYKNDKIYAMDGTYNPRAL